MPPPESLALIPQPRPPQSLPLAASELTTNLPLSPRARTGSQNQTRTEPDLNPSGLAQSSHLPGQAAFQITMSDLKRKGTSHNQRKEAVSWFPSKCDMAGLEEVVRNQLWRWGRSCIGTEPQDRCESPLPQQPDSQQILIKPGGVRKDRGQQAALCPLALYSVGIYGAPLCARTVLGTGTHSEHNRQDGSNASGICEGKER